MKTYEITIKPKVFTNDFPTINRTICVKRINPKEIFNEYYGLDAVSTQKCGKYCYYIKASYGLFMINLIPI